MTPTRNLEDELFEEAQAPKKKTGTKKKKRAKKDYSGVKDFIGGLAILATPFIIVGAIGWAGLHKVYKKNGVESWSEYMQMRPQIKQERQERREEKHINRDYNDALKKLENNKGRKASKFFEEMVAEHPQEVKAHIGLGDSYTIRKDYDDALRKYEDALDLEPTNSEALLKKASLLHIINNKDREQTTLELLVNNDSTSTWAQQGFSALSSLALDNNEYKLSLAYAQKSLALNDTDAKTWSLSAQAKISLEQYESAYQDISQALSLDSENSSFYVQRGRIKFAQGEVMESIADFREAIDLDKRNPIVNKYFGKALFQAQMYDEAADALYDALKSEPENLELHEYYGRTQMHRGYWPDALRHLEKVTDVDSSRTDLYKLEFKAQIKLEELEEAVNTLGLATENNPQALIELWDELDSAVKESIDQRVYLLPQREQAAYEEWEEAKKEMLNYFKNNLKENPNYFKEKNLNEEYFNKLENKISPE